MTSKFLRTFLPLILALSITSILAPAVSAKTSWSPRDFGAQGDGVTLDTAAVQKAIDTARDSGGGTVEINAGTYLIGTIELRTNVTLQLAKGATLLGSPRLADYRRGNWPALIKAKNQKNIAIIGEGIIDGQGKLVAADSVRLYNEGNFLGFFPGIKPGEKLFTGIDTEEKSWIDPHAMAREGTLANVVAPRSRADMSTWRVDGIVRPQLIELWECRDVRVDGVTLQHATSWVFTCRDTDDIVIKHVRIDSTTYWNNDGIDIVNCRRVRIEDCDVNAADDGICLKSEKNAAGRTCEDITVLRCRIRSSASAFKLGTSSYTAFRRIRVEDLEVYDTYRSAIALETVDGGILEDVKITRVRARNTGNALFLRIGQRIADRPPGVLRNIEISDLTADIPATKPDAGYEHAGPPAKERFNLIPASIVGLPDQPIENVTLRNITITYGGGARREIAEVPLDRLGDVPERRPNYPEFNQFGELPAWAFFVRDAKNVRFENITFRLASPDFRAAFVADRADTLTLDNVTFGSTTESPVLVLSHVTNETLTNITWPNDARQTLLRLPATQTSPKK